MYQYDNIYQCCMCLSFYSDAHDLDEVNLMWGPKEPIVLTQAAVNEGQGVITSVEHGECDWSAFPGDS